MADEQQWRRTESEIAIMTALRQHPYVVQIIDAISTLTASSSPSMPPAGQYGEFLILMEYCERGHLVDLLNHHLSTRTRLPDATIWQILFSLCLAVAALHQQGTLHRDIKIENILMTAEGTFKLSDFGSCTTQLVPPGTRIDRTTAVRLEEEIQKQTTIQYRPPEMCDVYRKLGIGLSADIWAIGVLAYKLCFYTTPFEEGGPLAILSGQYSIPHGQYPNHLVFIRISFRLLTA